MKNKNWKRSEGAADYFEPQDDRKRERKTRQLCRQVFKVVSGALAGECGDELLRDLMVMSVEPAPDAGRLLVKVFGAAGPGFAPHVALERLERVRARLRHAVACAIVRKRAPELAFMVVASSDEARDGEVLQ